MNKEHPQDTPAGRRILPAFFHSCWITTSESAPANIMISPWVYFTALTIVHSPCRSIAMSAPDLMISPLFSKTVAPQVPCVPWRQTWSDKKGRGESWVQQYQLWLWNMIRVLSWRQWEVMVIHDYWMIWDTRMIKSPCWIFGECWDLLAIKSQSMYWILYISEYRCKITECLWEYWKILEDYES